MDPRLIEWIAARPGLSALAMTLWRITWVVAVVGALGLLGGALALGGLGVGGHDLAGRIMTGALLGFAAVMIFSIGSLARLSAEQLKSALTARAAQRP